MKRSIIGITTSLSLVIGIDASILNEVPLAKQEVVVAGEIVSVEQKGDVIETVLPWKDQAGISVAYDMETTITERLLDRRNKAVITETVDFGDGGFKVDILLKEKPDTNRFCYTITGWEDYDFDYQPPLTAEQIAEGVTRPDDIVGSYAVYHKTLANHRIGGENYKTGKVMHIPRPQVWEIGNEANKVWAELSYDQGQLCVTAPQDFIDNADYTNGVRIDPTFGYTSIGASCNGGFSATMRTSGNTTNPGESGTGDSMSVHSCLSTAGNIQAGIYINSSNAYVGNTPSMSTLSTGWLTSTLNASPSLSATDYLLVAQGSNGSIGISNDQTGGLNSKSEVLVSFGTWPSTASWTAAGVARNYSIYATYTATGGSSSGTTTTINLGNGGSLYNMQMP